VLRIHHFSFQAVCHHKKQKFFKTKNGKKESQLKAGGKQSGAL